MVIKEPTPTGEARGNRPDRLYYRVGAALSSHQPISWRLAESPTVPAGLGAEGGLAC